MAFATQTAAAPSTATPLPTENRAATATPTVNAGEPPLITYLAPDRERIRGGESAVLTWETSRATTVALRANGTEQSVALAGSITLTPDVTTIYRLIARNSAGEDAIDVTIAVDPSEPTPTATPVPATMTPEAGASPSDAEPVVPIQSATEPPTSTPTDTPTATMMPSATPTESPIAIDTSTPTPILLATLTPTPILLATLTPTPTSTEAAVALAEIGALPPAASNRDAPTAPNAEALAAVDASVMTDSVTDSVADPVADSVADTGALRSAFGAMLLVMGAPLIAAGLALVVLRLRKRENA